MTTLPGFDCEVYSEAGYTYDEAASKWVSVVKSPPHGLGAVGAAAYAEHPSTQVLKFSYDLLDGNGPQLWRFEDGGRPVALCQHIESGGIIEATNALFEYWVWLRVCHERYGWPRLDLRQLRDAAAKARNYSLPPSLDKFTTVLGTPVLKQSVGKRLIATYTHPTTRKNWKRKLPWDYPEDNALFDSYCVDDTRSQMLASDMMPDLSPTELELYYYSEVINVRGAYVNRRKLDDCREIVEQATAKYTAELQELTGGYVQTASELAKMQTFISLYGYQMPNMRAETVDEWAARDDLPPVVHRVLEIRSLLNSASVKKLYALDRMLPADNRMKGLFVYQKADRSGRWGGVGPQAHNIPGGGPPVNHCESCGGYFRPAMACPYCDSMLYSSSKWCPDAVEWAHQAIATRSLDVVETHYGDAIKTVSGCLRSLYEAAPGYDLVSSDYSAIEAVVAAELAGETWRQEVFRTHGKIYEMSASKITGVPFEEFERVKRETGNHHEYRSRIGKVAELASGYAGWIGAWKNFGADKHFNDDREIRDAILKWRAESPNIVEFWGGQIRHGSGYGEHWYENYGLEGAAVSAIQNPGQQYVYKGLTLDVVNDVLRIQLLSGRHLYYHQPRLVPTLDRFSKMPIWQITYWGYNTDSKKGPVGWLLMETYGGKLFENVVQAVARDILGHAIVNLEKSVCRKTEEIKMKPMNIQQLISQERVSSDVVERATQSIDRMAKRVLWYHPESDCYFTTSGRDDDHMVDEHCCNVTGVEHHENAAIQAGIWTRETADPYRYAVVMHVHDEIVCEVPEGHGSVEEMESIMSTMPSWCSDWPVRARGGWRGKFFRKS